ncbi:hypothetical protein JOF29_007339 [Kribbella aluminosa]|uniref:DUF4272 domain-containing protein n=1 Tax=Kribbella aluminosa TaxID=416017 RepID=A0ABS4UXH7_9ACTN|nr:hypothetical protein [Kribbella aluminosa]MBP2356229.1 hypothetical protein [Kribbella aluminosa]
MWQPDRVTDPALIQLLDDLADRARNPYIAYLGSPDDRGDWGDNPPSDADLLIERRLLGAVTLAAIHIVDECIADIQTIGAAEMDPDGAPDPEIYADTFVWNYFPPRFRPSYDQQFFAKILVSAVKVSHDLANPKSDRPACIAEEIIVNAICKYAYTLMDEAGLDHDVSLEDLILDDTNFELLFSDDMDGVEDDPAMQRSLGMWLPPVEGWFTPFNTDRVVHPYAETDATTPRVHDLYHLLDSDELRAMSRKPDVVDAPAPITGFPPISEVVHLARQTTNADSETWVADDSDAEHSYRALVEIAQVAKSGWLTWEPHESADVVRSDAVVRFAPHRHYPVGNDQPWAEVAMTGGVIMHIPLSAIVSYRPDPAIYERWNSMYSSLEP